MATPPPKTPWPLGGDELAGASGGQAGFTWVDRDNTDTPDSVSGASGNDTLLAGFGDDTLVGNDGNDSLSGFHGDDLLVGGAGDDLLNGHSGRDTVLGGDGDDRFSSWFGDASLDGGSGNDTMSWAPGDGNDTFNGGDGADVLHLYLRDLPGGPVSWLELQAGLKSADPSVTLTLHPFSQLLEVRGPDGMPRSFSGSLTLRGETVTFVDIERIAFQRR